MAATQCFDMIHIPTGRPVTAFLTPQEIYGIADKHYRITVYVDLDGQTSPIEVKLSDLQEIDDEEPSTKRN